MPRALIAIFYLKRFFAFCVEKNAALGGRHKRRRVAKRQVESRFRRIGNMWWLWEDVLQTPLHTTLPPPPPPHAVRRM